MDRSRHAQQLGADCEPCRDGRTSVDVEAHPIADHGELDDAASERKAIDVADGQDAFPSYEPENFREVRLLGGADENDLVLRQHLVPSHIPEMDGVAVCGTPPQNLFQRAMERIVAHDGNGDW